MPNERPSKLDSTTFDQFLEHSNPFVIGGPCVFDLRGIGFITPASLVDLTAACYALHRDGLTPKLLIDNGDVRRYLMRAAFFAALDGIVTVEPALSPAWKTLFQYHQGQNPLLIEVTKIISGAALPQLLDQIVSVLRYRLKYKKYDAFDIATAVSELAQNTFDHNQDTSGFLAMQVYGKRDRRFLEIAVADYGFGIRTTLARNPKNPYLASDGEAIRLAIQRGASEHDDPTRGTGLFHLLEITYKHQGSVQIRSGTSKARFRMYKKQGWYFSGPRMPGVQVALTLPSKARLTESPATGTL